MFPAKSIVKCDENESISLLEKENFHCIKGIRIIGLFHQLECLISLSIDVLSELAMEIEKISKRIIDVESKMSNITQNILYNTKNFLREEKFQNTSHKNESIPNIQLTLSCTKIVQDLIETAEPSPDFSSFNIFLSLTLNDYIIDVNKCFSDPDFFKRQYIQELLKQCKEYKEELKRNNKRKSTFIYHHDTKKNNVHYFTQCPPAIIPCLKPKMLICPPPKGQAFHQDIPISLLSQNNNKEIRKQYQSMRSLSTFSNIQSKTQFKKIKPVLIRATAISKSQLKKKSSKTNETEIDLPYCQEEQSYNTTSNVKINQSLTPPVVERISQNSIIPPPPISDLIIESDSSFKDSQSEDIINKDQHNAQSPKPISHLDLIKMGKYKLKKVDIKPPQKQRFNDIDPTKLTVQEILRMTAKIREVVACSESSSDESSSSTSSW